MDPLLEVKNFHYYYGNIHVIKGIDLYVNPGELVTIIGANGAGKTTTLHTISGLTDPKGVQGEIWYKGQLISKMKPHKIMNMGLVQVLEGRHIFSKLTTYENLMAGAYTRKDTKGIKEDIQDVFKLFPRLEERKTQLGGTLSGGEQQMLAIGRALMGKPEMLLLDEPSLDIAPIIVEEIFKAIKRIREEKGTTILFVEQNSKIALNTAERGYVFQTGEVIIQDTCENLIQNPDIRRAYLGEDQ